ncbi:MAG: autotransporter outer membrane beta-barrel domain-containing protein [Pseudolabrys sp.]|nr:autotransporter outer membrane beta-barrel domain-containing protein [Pseudolabrys sp.]
MPAFGERVTSGPSPFALSYASRRVTATRSELGARFDRTYLVDHGAMLTVFARLAWAHDWNTAREATATFQTLPGATFVVYTAQPSANAALASVGVEMK